jgi:hypothetical protein
VFVLISIVIRTAALLKIQLEKFMRYLSCTITLVFCCVILVSTFGNARAGDVEHPFGPGEKMHFVLKYGVIPAGEATLEVRAVEKINGVDAYHFIVTARSNSFIDMFFKVRDRVDSYADLGMNHSLYYRKKQHEGNTIRDITVNFDWGENKSTYVNLNTEPKIIDLMPGSFDPLSVFYFSRLLDLNTKSEFVRPVTDGEKNLIGNLRVSGSENISVEAGTFKTLVLEPEMQDVEGIFAKEKRAKIKLWVTDDERRLLVKMSSKAMVGSFVAELASFEGHDAMRVSKLKE